MATVRPRTKLVYNTQQERINSTPAGVQAAMAARGQQIVPQPLGPARTPFSEMPIGRQDQYQRHPMPQQQPAAQRFGGAPMPAAGTPQSANWMQPRQSSMTKMQAFGMAPMPPDAPFAVDEPVIPNTAIRPQNVMTYGPNVVPQRGSSYQPPSPNSSVFLPRGPMSSSASLQAQQGFQTDQYGRQYQMTPQMAGTAMPTGGAGAWMQGRSLSGAPAGVYVQSNLPAPSGGMERSLAGMAGQRPSAFAGPASSAAIAAMTGGRGPGSEAYQAMRARRQQQADQRIVARARIRGLGQNTPAVRMAMQRLGMTTPAQQSSQIGQQAGSVPQIQDYPSGEAAGRDASRLAKGSTVLNTVFAGVDPLQATPDQILAAVGRGGLQPNDEQTLRRFVKARMSSGDTAFSSLPLQQRLMLDAYAGGGLAAMSRLQQANQRQSEFLQNSGNLGYTEPGFQTGGGTERGWSGSLYGTPGAVFGAGTTGSVLSPYEQRRLGQPIRNPYRGTPQF